MIQTTLRTRALTFAIGLTVTSLALAGCSTAAPDNTGDTGSADETLKIGFVTPLTGPSSSTGVDARDGAQLAVDLANKSGLLPGVKIELLIEDDKGTPEIATVAAQKLRDEGAQVITGTMNSSVAVAIANAIGSDPDALYMISGAQIQTPLDEQAGNSIFGLTHTNAQYAAANLAWIKDEAKPKKVAFMGENSDFGVQELKQLEAAWGSGSPEIVLKETFDRTATDYSPILSKVRDSGADGLYVAAASSSIAASVFTQADQLGLDVKKFMNAGLMTPDLIKAGGEAVEGITSADIYNPALDNAENTTFVTAFNKAYDKDPTSLNDLGYDSINLILGAMKDAGTTTDMSKVASTLRDGTWKTPRGELTWDKTGRALTDTLIIGVKDGKLALVDTVPNK